MVMEPEMDGGMMDHVPYATLPVGILWRCHHNDLQVTQCRVVRSNTRVT